MSVLIGRKCGRDPQHNGQRTLGAAEGVLVTLRRCSLDEAFAEIVKTAKLRNVAPIELANALVAIAERNGTCDIAPDALAAAQQTWSALVEDRTSIGGR